MKGFLWIAMMSSTAVLGVALGEISVSADLFATAIASFALAGLAVFAVIRH